MPEKSPTLWLAVWDALPEPVRAALFSTVIAFFRVMYDDKEPRWIRKLLEVGLCGSLGFVITYLAVQFGFAPAWGGAISSVISLYGVNKARAWGQEIARRRLDRGAS
ncbi:phage holin family protein [Thauera sp.]|uniref:phage holin family protein n=1 Tax=Thauera sp. TaxID=1905334 RepID=UPI0039E5EF8A